MRFAWPATRGTNAAQQRVLRRALAGCVIILAITGGLSQAAVGLLGELRVFGELINEVGHQRMRAQQLMLQAVAPAPPDDAAPAATLAAFLATHERMMAAHPDAAVARARGPALQAVYESPPHRLDATLRAYVAALRGLQQAPDPDGSHARATRLLLDAQLMPGLEAATTAVTAASDTALRDLTSRVWVMSICGGLGGVLLILGFLLPISWSLVRATSAAHAFGAAHREMEVRYQALVDNSFEGVVLHENGTIREASPAMAELFGERVEALIGTSLYDRFFAEDISAPRAAVLADPKTDTALEVRARRADGSVLVVEIRGRPCLYQGRPVRSATVRDVTAQRRADAALRAAKEQAEADTLFSQSITNLAPNHIFIVALPSRAVIFSNRAAQPGPQQIPEEVWIDGYVHPDDAPTTRAVLDGFLTQPPDDIVQFNQRIRSDSGEWRWHVIREKIFRRGADGRPDQIIGIAQDISELKAREAEVMAARAHAEELARSKGEFLANMSHEIRTPLNGVIGMADLLLDTPLNAEQRKLASIVQASGAHLLALINDVLDMSKIEAGKMQVAVAPLELRAVVEAQADLFATKATEKGLGLHVFVDPSLPDMLLGDAQRLGQVLINLIGNALKFTERGSVVVRAERAPASAMPADAAVSARYLMVRLSVQDTGIGIPEAARQRLFAPFVQADASTARRYGGTGLGLSICRRLAELMHGVAGVESVVGEGSTFWFTARLELPTPAQPSPQAAAVLAGLRVLIVDDDAYWRDIAGRYLTAWQVEPVFASDAAAGWELLQASAETGPRFDAVLLDKRLPGEDGFALAARVRETQALREVPLLLVTGFDRAQQRQEAEAAGFAAYLTKPVRRDELFRALEATRLCAVRPAVASAVAPQPSDGSARQREILVAEDNMVNQLLVMTFLKQLGYAATAVKNGHEALQALAGHSYDLVLMDCQMPELDGFEATRRLRAAELSGTRRLPVIALTANALKEDAAQCLRAGMDAHLAKPIKRDVLAAELTRWLGPAAHA